MLKKLFKGLFLFVAGTTALSMLFSKKFHSQPIEEIELEEIEEESVVKFDILFSGGAKYVKLDHFQKAELKCRFGGMEVYFDEATLHNGKGYVQVDLSFGGIELYIPKDWTVVNNIKVAAGAVEMEDEPEEANPEKVLTLVGALSMGAVEVHYV